MKNTIRKRILSLFLTAVLLLGVMPSGVVAVEMGTFVLVVESNGALVIAPEHIQYTVGQTVGEALTNSNHTFVGLDEGWIREIDGVGGNYTRSDQNGGHDLSAPASDVRFYRFSEDTNSQPSAGLMKLMTAMADYQQKSGDVQAAAKEEYETAVAQFVGIDSASATALASALNEAVKQYEDAQSGPQYSVTFTDGVQPYTGVTLTAKNAYGKEWVADGGVLKVPAGVYTFCLEQEGLRVEGSIEVAGNMTVTAVLPETPWLDTDAFRLSGSYGAESSTEQKFSDDEYTVGAWNGRETAVAVSDTFTGRIYTYAEYRTDLLKQTPTLTAIYPSASTGEKLTQVIPFQSFTTGAFDVLKRGVGGNTVIYRISSLGSDGYTYSQDYSVTFHRIPSLTAIRVKDQNGVDQTAHMAFDGNVTEYLYKVVDTVSSVTVQAEPLDESYIVTVNGEDATKGVTVALHNAERVEIPVEISGNGYTNTYTLTILPGEGKKISFVTDRADITLEVVNANGEVMPYEKCREGASGNRYQYVLVPGETYRYVATADVYYHVADTFTMEDVADSTIRVDVPTEDWLTELAFGTKNSSKYKGTLPLHTEFVPEHHSYEMTYVDTEHNVYLWVDSAEDVTIQAIYQQTFSSNLYHGQTRTVALDAGKTTGIQLNRFLMDENPIENFVTIRLSKQIDGVTCYQEYVVAVKRTLTLQDISATCGGMPVTLVQEDTTQGFLPAVKEYSVTVSMEADTLFLSLVRYTENLCYGESAVGYRVKVDGVDVTQMDVAEIVLDGTLETQTVTITVENDKAPNGSTDYLLHILKSPPVEVLFDKMPEDALLAVYETMSGERLWPNAEGQYLFCEGYSYCYALTAYGYISKSGTLCVTRNEEKALVVTDGEDTYAVTETPNGGGALTLRWTLTQAEKNDSLQKDLEAYWPNFRGEDSNNAVTDAMIPTTAESGTLYWANQLGDGFDSDAVGSPILVDGDLITYAGDTIYRVDTVTGEILQTGTMDHKSSFSITPPTYAEGIIFVALSNGTVQAFHATTLESLWLYEDPLGGQPNCPLTVKDGYLYTGFWNSETGYANFVCLSITDEIPAQEKESKCASWYYTAKGGYYWAGAYVSDDFVLVGTDDGTNFCTGQSSSLLVFHPKTGAVLDRWDGLNGDIRSTIVYDRVTDAYYFTSKGGSFYAVQMVQTDDGWEIANSWSVALSNGSNGTPMSTSSPVVYNGRAYVGVSGAGQFAAYSGHNITVIDLNRKTIAYRVQTSGYPQTSGLLTTAYEAERGYVYVYFFDNMTPGVLRVLRDKAGQTKADYVTTEGENTTAYALFTPTGEQAQYAICSPIVDAYGTVYFKNDSAHLMAFGSAIQKIEVTKQPNKMVYAEGEAFDPTGMVVIATYENGQTRDVTKYVTFDTETVSAEHPLLTISFPYVLYHNTENGTEMTAGTASTTPTVTLQLEIGEAEEPVVAMGDVNEDGYIDTEDAGLLVDYYYGNRELSEEELARADVNRDGTVDTEDVGKIMDYYYGIIDGFSV